MNREEQGTEKTTRYHIISDGEIIGEANLTQEDINAIDADIAGTLAEEYVIHLVDGTAIDVGIIDQIEEVY